MAILSLRTHIYAFTPPLPAVEASYNGRTVNYRVFDPVRGVSQSGSVTHPDLVSFMINNQGIVAWIAGRNVWFAVYDPIVGSWKYSYAGYSTPGLVISSVLVIDGVVTWLAGGKRVEYRTYDPATGDWIAGSRDMSEVVSILVTDNGVIAWRAGNQIEFTVYDPSRHEWRWSYAYYSTPPNGPVLSPQGAVTWSIGGLPQTRGYNAANGSWQAGGAVAFAYFVAGPTAGNAPLPVWFIDMSLGGTSWSWNFGDGGSSSSRSPLHTFQSFGRYAVAQTVGGSSFQTNVTTDASPPTGSITINSGAASTVSPNVALSILATDNSGRVSAVRFSNDGTRWSTWEPYVINRPWTLSPGNGVKTVQAQFKDALDNISATFADTILREPFPITIQRTLGGVVTLSWPSISGNGYRVEYRTGLMTGNWTIGNEIVATGATASMTIPTEANARRFYRVFELP